MKTFHRTELLAATAALTFVAALASGAQTRSKQPTAPTPATAPQASAAGTQASPALARSRVFAFDGMPKRTMANGGESRDIVHGTLASGETLNLHESMQTGGAAANPMHVIQHSELILVREGELEFQHEEGGRLITERVGAGGAIYVALGTKHTIRNAGSGAASYFVLALGGDAK